MSTAGCLHHCSSNNICYDPASYNVINASYDDRITDREFVNNSNTNYQHLNYFDLYHNFATKHYPITDKYHTDTD